ncbi:DUF1801 domain-containing protein [Flavobacterium hercynium]|uniref:YdhG-like domain-containing protein n=1 Tax=Flavobacterium hercynium TaxID=387094 RepID=A0A226HHR6_9FLAO|nr:DUF1801 domain-containing protein [Flavobacterium hercynium]OXA93216.1 hypothetical protein B0A66_06985 [Flavobacterium hercynium]SMP36085.1 protein of unknown function (DU1801) [Flavobacterium hercynium]
MAKNKTIETDSSVTHFVNTVENEAKRKDSFELIEIMKTQTTFEPKMWGTAIIGFGSYHYKYASGREGDAPLVAFSPRKEAISLYLYPTFENKENLLSRFGKYKAGKGCIYIKKVADIDIEILKEMISISVQEIQQLYPSN